MTAAAIILIVLGSLAALFEVIAMIGGGAWPGASVGSVGRSW